MDGDRAIQSKVRAQLGGRTISKWDADGAAFKVQNTVGSHAGVDEHRFRVQHSACSRLVSVVDDQIIANVLII